MSARTGAIAADGTRSQAPIVSNVSRAPAITAGSDDGLALTKPWRELA